jgi:Zn-dependent peptidase ImmA (M78 family)/transcriptional regulator with XRE-family HTH domain
MDIILHKLPQRLSEVRSLAGLSQSELAKQVGVSTSLISHWEKGTRTPSEAQVLTLAQHLGVTLDYLLNANVRPQFKFRAQKTSPQHEAIETALLDASVQVHFVDTGLRLAEKPPKPFSLRADFDSFAALPNITTNFRQTLKLNRRVTLDELKQALAEWNIFVFDWSMPWHLSGLSFRGPFTVIFINHEHSTARRLFTLAHEFAHVVFHLDRPGKDPAQRHNTLVSIASHRDPLEKEANAFAGEFLIPTEDLEDLVENYGSRIREPAGLEAAARHFNVSRDAIFYRLTQLNVLTWADKSTYFGGSFPLQDPPPQRVTEIDQQVDPIFRDLALYLHQQEKISTGKLAQWFFTPRHVIDKYLADMLRAKRSVIADDSNHEDDLAVAQ